MNMSKDLFSELKLSADLALKGQTAEEGIPHLSKAFTLFSKEASRLKEVHLKLQDRFDTVNKELEKRLFELKRVSHFLANLLGNISEAILFISLDGTLLMINEAGEKLLKFEAKQILFQKFSDFFEDLYFGFSMKEALKFGISHKILYKTIQNQELEISTSFVYDGPKPYHGLILLLRDITEKKRLQSIANRNDRMTELGQMAATVAHEIRNPLGGIRGYASLLYRDLKDQKPLQEMASYIMEGTKALENLVSTVLHYARPVQIVPESLDVSSFLKQLAKFVRVDPAFPRNVSFEVHVPDEPLLAPFDPGKLKSALLNLLFNAFHALSLGGRLTLALIKRESTYEISVSDTGIGMEEDVLKEIFSPFFTTKQKGNGFGLVEVEKIVHAHFGTIEVRSQVGKGSTFTITLPLKR